MNKINVVDFDKTLIAYDSFHAFCLLLLMHSTVKIKVIQAIIIRVLRLSDRRSFKETIDKLSKNNFLESQKFKDFVNRLFEDIQPEVMNEIEKQCTPEDLNVLVSASPDTYIRVVAERLGWTFLASHENKSGYVEMYGRVKLEFIRNLYPPSEYIYNFAISDSESDMELLKSFRNFKLIK